ncbi:MAG: hypothetical protein AB1390_08460 [Nitrospirota bacterium]
MRDEEKTKAQLINELSEIRRRIDKIEKLVVDFLPTHESIKSNGYLHPSFVQHFRGIAFWLTMTLFRYFSRATF